jgi:uracil-DNA glycosylase family 4
MLVGEGPGHTEEQTGRPFVGESGRLLRALMKEAGLIVEVEHASLSGDFYITNVVKHRPPKNRTPKPDEVVACLPYLGREVAIVQPKVVVLIGETAMCLAFKAKNKVKKTHGRWGTLPGTNVQCVAMIHPAAIGRMLAKDRPGWLASCVDVLRQAKKVAEGWKPPQVAWSWAQGKVPQKCAFDIEATSEDQRIAKMILAAAYDGTDTQVWTQPATAMDIPEDADLTTHHTAYDGTVLVKAGKINLRKISLNCTMVKAHTMGLPDLSLKGLSGKILDTPIPSFADVIGNAEEAPTKQLAGYCARDAVQDWKLDGALTAMARPQDLVVYEEIERPLLPIVCEMDAFGGFELDRDSIEQELAKTFTKMLLLEGQFKLLSGKSDININSGDQVEALFRELGLPLKKRTDSGARYSVDVDVLKILQPYHSCVGVLLAYRKLQKRISTYLKPWLAVDGNRLTSLWQQCGTRTYRFSSTGPNLQNIPASLRWLLIARPGHVLVCADASQIEYRVAAHLSKDPHMLQAYLDGRDMHDETCVMLGWLKPGEKAPHELRRQAKVFNFGGILYGGSAKTMMVEARKHDLPLTLHEAEKNLQIAEKERPVYYAWAEETGQGGVSDGYIDGLYGRRFRLQAGTSFSELAHEHKQAVNYPIQGGAQDIVKKAMRRTWDMGPRINAQVHDEIVWELPEGEAEEFAAHLPEVLEAENPLCVPTPWDIHVGARWKEAA